MVDTRIVLDRVEEDSTFFGDKPEVGERGSALPEGYWVIDSTIHEYREPTVRDLQRAFDIDPQLQATELAMTQPLRSAEWSIEPTNGDKGEATYCREMLETPPHKGGMKTPMNKVVAQCTRAPFLRRTHFELVWSKDRQNRDILHKIAYRPTETCKVMVDRHGEVIGFRQIGMDALGNMIDEPFGPNKSFVYIHGAHRDPVRGHSLAQTAYRTYLDKQKVLRLYFIHLQNVALSSIKGQYDGPEGKAGQDKLTRKLQTLRGGGTVVLGPGEDANFFEGGRAGEEFRNALRYLDSQIAGSMLMRFLQLGTDSNTGSWSLSRDHSDFYLMSLESIQHEIAEAITMQILAPVVFWNFGPDAAYPIFTFQRLAESQRLRALDTWEKLMLAATPPPVKPAIMDAIVDKAMPALDINLQQVIQDESGEELEPSEEEGDSIPPQEDTARTVSPEPLNTRSSSDNGINGRIDRVSAIVEALNNRGSG